MSLPVGGVRRWDTAVIAGAGEAVASRRAEVEAARRVLAEGVGALGEGWDGRAADAVLEAADGEGRHLTRLSDGLDDLVDTLRRAHAALGPAVQSVRNRIADAEAAGLAVDRSTVGLHGEAISFALHTVRSLDEHYGREIDEIAARLRAAIPPGVDRSRIPSPDDPWPGRGVDAITGAMMHGNPKFADDLDPETRGRHALNPVPDDFGRAAGAGLRGLGRIAGPLGGGLTVYDGMTAHAEGRTSTGEALWETTGALGGGMLGGVAAGAVAGSIFGPMGTFIGAGIGAAVGTYLGRRAGDAAHEQVFGDRE